jgi:hypothetical protein
VLDRGLNLNVQLGCGIELRKFGSDQQAAVRNVTNATPAGVSGLKDLREEFLSFEVPFRFDDAAILGFDMRFTGNGLLCQHQHAL